MAGLAQAPKVFQLKYFQPIETRLVETRFIQTWGRPASLFTKTDFALWDPAEVESRNSAQPNTAHTSCGTSEIQGRDLDDVSVTIDQGIVPEAAAFLEETLSVVNAKNEFLAVRDLDVAVAQETHFAAIAEHEVGEKAPRG